MDRLIVTGGRRLAGAVRIRGAKNSALKLMAASLHGAMVSLDFPSVGATENLLMAAVAASGTTVIENAAREPEIQDLASMLVEMGGKIDGAGSTAIEIQGTESFHPVRHRVV